jgi:two-component system, chemotaxis family, CheB/CheR fusion protein
LLLPENHASLESKKKRNLSTPPKLVVPIAGIGASAGGLDAIKRLLGNLPENTGISFVIVQHLATGQESMLPEILSRFTKMPVDKVQSGKKIEPNHVFVIPAGTIMTMENGKLQLKPKHEFHKPIDEFFVSLAQEQKTHAIGIVLSGTGTDGTEGLKFIKGEGGITFAQDPKSAQYADMPKNAIAAETVDFVLPPEKIAHELAEIAKHPEIARRKMENTEHPEEGGEDKQAIFTLLRATFNVNFANYKKSTTDRRIMRRMVLKNIESIKKYVAYLRIHREELQALFEDLLIGVTGFFREPQTFALLRENAFPTLIEKKSSNQPVRVWVPGCSTGEEAYSVAITIQEFLEEKNILDLQVQIFGTDVNDKKIEKARRGIYLKAIEETVPEKRLKRFFTSFNGNYQITKQIRDMCVFAKHDLTNDPPFSNLDIIVCRNVLIYFDAKLQEKIIPFFHYGLKPNCYLTLGESESVGKFTYLFEPMTKKGIIFKKKQAQPRVDFQTEAPTPSIMRKPFEQPSKTDSMVLLEKEVNRLLMSEFVPASLVLNSNLDVLGFRGKVEPYLSVDAGTATFNVIKIVRKELRPALQTAVYRAKKGKKEIKETVRTEQDNQTTTVTIQIKPLTISKIEDTFFLVLFGENIKVKPSRQTAEESNVQVEALGVKDQQIKELSEDLESTKKTLQTVIEQQEATNEELRSSMEELQSGNEELMSTNEELETAKEELQSTNEELTTLNDELKNRNQTVSNLNDDLVNLMDNVDTAVVIVDNDFKIKRFTTPAQELLRLTPNDIEHSITEIRLGIPTEELQEPLSSAVTKLNVIRKEINAGKNRWYQMRIRPYITQEKKIGGAVLSFSDITEIKAWENERKLHTENLEHQVKEQAGALLDAESLVAIGKTAGMVGHDIRNPLQAITNDIYLVKSDLTSLPENEAKKGIRESLESIEKNTEYINKIVSDLQDFARKEAPKPVAVNVEKIIQEILSSTIIPQHVAVSISMQKDFPTLILDESYLKRIMTNLISNAVQAMPTDGKLTIAAFRQNDRAVINVQDNGMGIPEELKSKMFKPLFTTKAKGQGFGLAVVKKLTEAMQGIVTFESENRKGTKFILSFPIP